MQRVTSPTAVPFDAVIFDFHGTLIDQGSGREWLESAWQLAGLDGDLASAIGPREVRRLSASLERIWDHAREIDPENERDLGSARHREVFDEVIACMGGIDAALIDPLYATLTDGWTAYDDARPVLAALKADGIRTAVLSNVGFDIRPVLVRTGLMTIVDAVALSCEIGVAKPDPAAFSAALDLLVASPESTLMVGDNWHDDGGAAGAGIRTLILPPTTGPTHGLDAVTGLVSSLASP